MTRLRGIMVKLGLHAPVSNEQLALELFSHLGNVRRAIDRLFERPVADDAADETFDKWFDREYPKDEEGRRPKYQQSSVRELMLDAWDARAAAAQAGATDAELTEVAEQIMKGMRSIGMWQHRRGYAVRVLREWLDSLPTEKAGAGQPEPRAELADADKLDAERWRKCKTMRKAWWLEAMDEAGEKGGRSLDEAIDAARSGASR